MGSLCISVTSSIVISPSELSVKDGASGKTEEIVLLMTGSPRNSENECQKEASRGKLRITDWLTTACWLLVIYHPFNSFSFTVMYKFGALTYSYQSLIRIQAGSKVVVRSSRKILLLVVWSVLLLCVSFLSRSFVISRSRTIPVSRRCRPCRSRICE